MAIQDSNVARKERLQAGNTAMLPAMTRRNEGTVPRSVRQHEMEDVQPHSRVRQGKDGLRSRLPYAVEGREGDAHMAHYQEEIAFTHYHLQMYVTQRK